MQLIPKFAFENPDHFQKIAAGLQSIVVSLGVILSGLGATALLLPRGIETWAEYDRLTAEHKPVLNIKLSASPLYIPELRHAGILGTVTIDNPGIQEVTVNYRHQRPIWIGKYDSKSREFNSYCVGNIWLVAQSKPVTQHSFDSHEVASFNFVADIDQPGTYMVEYLAGMPRRPGWVYVASTVISIGGNLKTKRAQLTVQSTVTPALHKPANPPNC